MGWVVRDLEIRHGNLWRFHLSRVGNSPGNEKLIRRKWLSQSETCNVCLILFLIAEQGVRNMPIKPWRHGSRPDPTASGPRQAARSTKARWPRSTSQGSGDRRSGFQEQPSNAEHVPLECTPLWAKVPGLQSYIRVLSWPSDPISISCNTCTPGTSSNNGPPSRCLCGPQKGRLP